MKKIIDRIRTYKHLEYVLLSLAILLGFVVRLYKIGNPIADWHSWRQADTASVSKTYVDKGIKLLYPRYQDISSIQTGKDNPNGYRFVEFPFFNSAQAVLFKYIGLISFEKWGRLISIVCSLISSYFLYLIGKKFIGKWGGVLSAFFFLFLPFNIYFSRVILPDPMGVAFGIAGMWFFVRFIDTDKKGWLLLSGILLSCSALIKPFLLFYTFPLIYLLLQKYPLKTITKNRKILIPLVIFSVIIIIPFISWRFWMNLHPEGIPFYKWAFNGDKIRFRPAFWRWIFGERIGYLILGIWGLVPFTFGILNIKKKNLFNIVFFLGSVFYLLLVATANVRHDYYQILIIPSLCLILAEGSMFLIENKLFIKKLSRFVLGFSIVMMFGMSAYQVKEFYKINHPEIIEAGNAVKRLTPENALIIASYNGDTAFLYQTGRWGWPAIDSSIDEIIQKGASYLVSVNFGDKDVIDAMTKYKTIEKTPTYVILDLHQPI